MFPESDLLPISALQHLLYCPRQCALIHVERLWVENRLTVEGRHLHAKAHAPKIERRRGVRTVRGMALRSMSLGLFGVADVVEFHAASAGPSPGAGAATVLPIEYKRGKPKAHDADRVQLCAQALCLEEMLGIEIEQGLLFYGKTRRREEVTLTPLLRDLTTRTAADLHSMMAAGRTPPARYEKHKCDRCSLKSLCLPEILAGSERASRYLDRMLAGVIAGPGPNGDDAGFGAE